MFSHRVNLDQFSSFCRFCWDARRSDWLILEYCLFFMWSLRQFLGQRHHVPSSSAKFVSFHSTTLYIRSGKQTQRTILRKWGRQSLPLIKNRKKYRWIKGDFAKGNISKDIKAGTFLQISLQMIKCQFGHSHTYFFFLFFFLLFGILLVFNILRQFINFEHRVNRNVLSS